MGWVSEPRGPNSVYWRRIMVEKVNNNPNSNPKSCGWKRYEPNPLQKIDPNAPILMKKKSVSNCRVITNYTSSSEWVILTCYRTRFTLSKILSRFLSLKNDRSTCGNRNKVNDFSKLYFLPCCFVMSWNQTSSSSSYFSYIVWEPSLPDNEFV